MEQRRRMCVYSHVAPLEQYTQSLTRRPKHQTLVKPVYQPVENDYLLSRSENHSL